MNYKTQGIVLKRMNFGEADRILTILTERFGKIKAIAKGVRKGKSKLAGHLEPFMLIDLQLHEGKTFYIVTGAEIGSDFPEIHNELKKTSQAFYLAELIDKFLPEHQKSEEVFCLFCQALEYLNKNEKSLFLRIFELKIIEASGFHPELYECVHCKNKLEDESNFWDAVEGGVICGDCQKKFQHGKSISNQLIKLLRLIEKSDFVILHKLKISDALEIEVEEILSGYIQSVLEKELRSKGFMKLLS
ncbi:MAG: DNA repair protein RecO [Patescibacteria group bacterium]|nr:DNA repair protein RecO [Patescibacteria group bacterium]